ncbi:hypothetical protein AV530_014290 [Patagioenas fasciata monilis]|uniref:Uncharacterized protein n=1 Tax=Patagioenas fasciata monilis TaxID=372326 RepID=A0A1V4KB80_PATFA|nr:hypothetical protein AV530_014290 [Patagioenas fasciata monilis]
MSARPAGAAGPRHWARRLALETLELLGLPCAWRSRSPSTAVPATDRDQTIHGFQECDQKMETDEQTVQKLIQIEEQMKAEIENERP